VRIVEFITRGDDMGGAQLHVVDMARQLMADGHDVLVLTGPAGVVTDRLSEHGVSWQSIPGVQREIDLVSDIRAVRSLVRVLRAWQPDVVACHSSKAGILGRIAARIVGVPVVFTVHGCAFTEGISPRRRRLFRVIERWFSRMAAALICVSGFDRELGEQAGIPPDLLVPIHNGIPDLSGPVPPLPGAGPLQVVMVGRFVPQKDQQLLVRALAGVDGVEAHFVGDGPELEGVASLARSIGVADRCAFHGFQRDVNRYLAASHVFCLISNWEGFPIATLEAMRAGRPTIVSDAGGAAEAVLDGATGFVVPRGDVERLRRALSTLANDRAWLVTMGEAARRRYEAEFTFDRMYARTVGVYEDALARHAARRRGRAGRDALAG
jgi:glycosyltransferase involved in cell wall biosynthesis